MHRTVSFMIAASMVVLLTPLVAHAAPVKRVVTDKAQYGPAQPAVISTLVTNNLGFAVNGYVQLTVRYLDQTIHAESQTINLASGNSQGFSFNWTTPAETLKGYGLDVDVYNGGAVVLSYSGALDVNDDWTRVPRYGFMSDFPESQSASQSESILAELSNYHINAVQFYDWMYLHHDLLKEETGVYADTYPDVANRTLSLTTIRNQISAAKARAMWPMAYDLAYGELTAIASAPTLAGYGQFINAGDPRPDSHPLAFWGNTIWLMNPADTNWQNYIYDEYEEAMTEVGFRGIHLDQLGNRGTRYDTHGAVIDFTAGMPSFINGTRTSARAVDAEARVIFNTVDAWPAQQVGSSSSDVSYSEVWTPSTYNDLRDLIITLKQYAPSKQVVLPAYMNKDQAASMTWMDSASVLLTDASIFANGAFHLELGESHSMLSTEYFPDHSPAVDSGLIGRLYDYYDFIVRYENLLYENTIDVTDGTIDWISLAEGTSKDGTAGKVWSIVKARPDEIVVHLVNLIGVDDDWRDTTPPPTVKTGFDYKYYTNRPVTAVFLATPDSGMGRPESLSFYTGHDEPYGNYVYIQNIPRLEYWDMLVLSTGASSSPPASSSHEIYIPWHTAAVDGTVDSGYGAAIAADNENGTNGQANSPMDLQNLYMSHDTNFIYFCFTINRNVTTGGVDWGKYVISIDTDGQAGSGGTAPGWGRAVTFADPHLPDYEIYSWVNVLPFETTDVQRWRYAGGSWANVGTIDAAALDSTASITVIEYKVAKSDLGPVDPPRLWVEVWCTGGAGTDNAQDSINNPKDDANPGDWVTVTPLKVSAFCHFVPARIGGLKVENIQDRLELTWNASDNAGFSRYDIFRSTFPFHDISGLAALGSVASKSTTSFTDTTVVPGETYYYAVVAVNSLNDSDPLVYRWEAERGFFGKSAAIDVDHTGYTGDAFCDQLDADETNDWVEHRVNVAEAGYYSPAFIYSAGGVATVARLDVNGVEVAWPSLPQTASWDAWDTKSQSVWLNAGENTIKLGFEGGNAAFNYDRVELENPSGYVGGKIVINEILPVSLKDSAGVDADEWIELYNASDTAVDIGSWHVSNQAGSVYTLPDPMTIPAKRFVLVHFDTGNDETDYSDSVAHLYARGTPSDGAFNAARQCALYNDAWRIVDFVSFGSGASAESDAVLSGIWTSGDSVNYSAAEGKSIHLAVDGEDNDSSGDWRVTASAGRASEGGTNAGMGTVDDSIESVAFMRSDWTAPLPSDTHAMIGDTLYIEMVRDNGDPSAIDFAQVLVSSGTDSPISVTLRETAINSDVLRGYAYIRNSSVSSMDRIGAANGTVITVQDFEGPDRIDTVLVAPAGCVVTGAVGLEAGSNESGCVVWLYNGVDTYTALTDSNGAFMLIGVANGTYNIRMKETHHIASRPSTSVTISGTDTSLGYLGELKSGDANNDNRIDILDASIVYFFIGAVAVGPDIDRNGIVNSADRAWIRANFGRVGDQF